VPACKPGQTQSNEGRKVMNHVMMQCLANHYDIKHVSFDSFRGLVSACKPEQTQSDEGLLARGVQYLMNHHTYTHNAAEGPGQAERKPCITAKSSHIPSLALDRAQSHWVD
jgi:NADH pyrophosphatase NudC (nudix superfamily)